MIMFAIALLGAPSLASAGKLSKFESDATTVKEENRSSDDCSSHDSGRSPVADAFVDSVVSAFTSSSEQSSSSDSPRGDSTPYVRRSAEAVYKHSPGSRLIPYLRVDAAAQQVEDTIKAVDLRGEVGNGALAGQLRYTRMWEDQSSESLTATYGHVLLRVPLDDHVQLDLGLGGLNLHGEDSNTGISATTPFQIQGRNVGFEFRPAWSMLNGNLVEDYDVAFVFGVPYVGLRVGYRWLLSENEKLRGPYAGMSLSW